MEPRPADEHPRCTVVVPGTVEYVDVLRSAAGLIARKMGFSYDGIEDLSVAVDEACVLLLEAPTPTLRATIEELADGDRGVMQISIVTDGTAEWDPEHLDEDLGWQVLRSLAERVDLIDGSAGAGFRIRQGIR